MSRNNPLVRITEKVAVNEPLPVPHKDAPDSAVPRSSKAPSATPSASVEDFGASGTSTRPSMPSSTPAPSSARVSDFEPWSMTPPEVTKADVVPPVRTEPPPREVPSSIEALGAGTGLGLESLLKEPSIPEKEAVHVALPRKVEAPIRQGALEADGLSDNPTSQNYRYQDTGYIGGSRKELAALRTQFRDAFEHGDQIKTSSINWEVIERAGVDARGLITKSHLFGKVDWEALKGGGMEPGAGFLVDRVYASVGKEPPEEVVQVQKDYALGLETLRGRLEVCKVPGEVTQALDEIKNEYDGIVLNDAEKAEYEKAEGQRRIWAQKIVDYDNGENVFKEDLQKVNNEIIALEYDQSKRLRRKWKADPEIEARIAYLKPKAEAARQGLADYRAANSDAQEEMVGEALPGGGISMRRVGVWRNNYHACARERNMVVERAMVRNAAENPVYRAWHALGERFVSLLNYRGFKGSDTFARHVATAKVGRIKDWSWAEKELVRVASSSRESTRFQLQVADTWERIGGRPSVVASSAELKASFGLRDAEYGDWVKEDFSSAKAHTERCAEAFADLVDLLGLDDQDVGIKGKLAMAFGARGHGAAGCRTSAPAAHYETQRRVINLTKNAGGGTLAHEWFHSLDNMLRELATGKAGKEKDWGTENLDILPPGALKEAMVGLRKAMLDGPFRHDTMMTYTGRDVLLARHNIDGRLGPRVGDTVAGKIKAAANIHDAAIAVQDHFSRLVGSNGEMSRATKIRMKDWLTVAAAYFGGDENGGEILVKSGEPTSRFAFEAVKLDRGSRTPYWSLPREMAARAFQSWTEDRLGERERRNYYLSAKADNSFYVDPFLGPQYPYPEGDERVRINAAFDQLFEALRPALRSQT